ncbi:MAG: hypothetical protein LUG56_10955 [Lachnospiraceae bacterium]|nr:hypothetical protein [Lachnospiraceae bacterium]
MKDWNNSFDEVFMEKGLQNSEFFLIIGNGIALNGCESGHQSVGRRSRSSPTAVFSIVIG